MSVLLVDSPYRVVPSFFKKESFFSHLKEAVTGTYYKGEPMGVEGWAYKSAGFFMQQFVMLAQSKGWGTLYMGGFDSQSIKKAFHIPKIYDVCCTIAVGYPDETEKYHEHPRFPPNMVIYENEFGKPTKTEVPEVKQTYFWKSALCVCWEPRVFWGHPTCLPFSHCFLSFCPLGNGHQHRRF